MREIDEVGFELCKYQSGLFELSVTYSNCSSAYFYKQFMQSGLAKRMDGKGFLFESLDVKAAIDDLAKEKDLSKGKNKIPEAVMAWVGYLLRYWSYTYEVPSSFLFKRIKLEDLVVSYEAYHSLDIEAAIERLSESKNIKYAGIYEDELYLIKNSNLLK